MEKAKYAEKIASNVPREVMNMLRKRQIIEKRRFEAEQREAEKARKASQTLMQIRGKFWHSLAECCGGEDLLRQIQTLQKHANKDHHIQ